MRFAAGALTRALSRGCSLSIQRSPQAVFLSPQRNSPVHAMLSSSVLLRCAPVATPSTSRSFVVSSPAQADKGCAAEVANAQPKGFYDMSNESLLMFCATGDFEGDCNIYAVDDCIFTTGRTHFSVQLH